MIVLEQVSDVRRGVTRDKILEPLIPESEKLGSGTYGTVFGPYSKARVLAILQSFYQNNILFWISIQKKCSDALSERKSYILRVDIKRPVCVDMITEDVELMNRLGRLPSLYKNYFIVPLIVGCFSFAKFEIQQYGGTELFDALANDPRLWTDRQQLHTVISSWYRLFKGCLWLLHNHNVLITDIKPENMVIDRNGRLSMIDIETVRIRQVKSKDDTVVFTLSHDYLPIQFLNNYFIDNARVLQDRRRRYLDKDTYRVRDQRILQRMRLMDDVPKSYEEVFKISSFTLVWVFLHILYYILFYKLSDKTFANHIWNEEIKKLYKERLDFRVDLFCKRIKSWMSSNIK